MKAEIMNMSMSKLQTLKSMVLHEIEFRKAMEEKE